jgi:eukaryotic-like serine/threonine-protein kinase
MPLEPGARLDAYEIVRPLGSGGMGEVWLAMEVRLGRKVALKLLPAELTRDPSRVLRFEQEARAASALSHPNVCTILVLGETGDGLRYIAMEYVEGETLRQRLAGARLSIRAALDIATQVAAALSAAHASGIVHRDIKPENVMVRPDGLVKVLDFGLAKLAPSPAGIAGADSTRLGALKTEAGVVVGTAAYMSPEQARGQEVDARTDIWSLGVLLYEMVAGRSPFAAPSGTEVLAAILDREPSPLARFEPDTPAELQRIVTKGLRKERALRYQVVQDLLLDLDALRDDVRAQARSGSGPVSIAAPPGPVPSDASGIAARVKRRRRMAFAAAAAVLVAAGAAGVWRWRATETRAPGADAGAPVERTLTRLTFASGLQTDATFSPDGRFIAYASDRAGNFDIWVQPVAGGDAVQVTRSPAQDTQPDWSPDGSTVVFRSERDGGGLFVVPALGGAERRLTSFGMHPQWVRGGSEILFIDSMGNYSPDESAVGSALKVYVTTPGSEQPTEILEDFNRTAEWRWVAGHPDGRLSFYGSHRDRGVGFFTVTRDGRSLMVSDQSPQVPPVLRANQWNIRRFRWNATGTALYLEVETGGVRNLWRVDVDPHTLRWLSAVRLTTGSSQEGALALSRDGTRIGFTVRTRAARLWAFVLEARGGRLADRGTPITEEGADVHEFDVARDSRTVAYMLTRAGDPTEELWTTDIGTGRRTLVARQAGMARWSFDGTRLAYVSFAQLPFRVVVTEESHGEQTVARLPADLPFPIPSDWTPDGSAVLASWRPTSGAPWGLTLWPAAQSAAQRPARTVLQHPHADLWQGRYSPNGKWIVAVKQSPDEPGRDTIVVAPAAGAPPAQWIEILRDHAWADKPRWSADGRTLYFISRLPTSFFNLWGIRFDPDKGTPIGEASLLTRYDSPSLMITPQLDRTEIGVAADRVVLSLQTVTGNVWMLDNVDR